MWSISTENDNVKLNLEFHKNTIFGHRVTDMLINTECGQGDKSTGPTAFRLADVRTVKTLTYVALEILTNLWAGPARLSRPVINKGSLGLKAVLIISRHDTGGPDFVVSINTVFLSVSNFITYNISIFILVIICLILRNKSQ
jgi:hypothetical protein